MLRKFLTVVVPALALFACDDKRTEPTRPPQTMPTKPGGDNIVTVSVATHESANDVGTEPVITAEPSKPNLFKLTEYAAYGAAGIGVAAAALKLPIADVTAPDPNKCEYYGTVITRRNADTGVWEVDQRACGDDDEGSTMRSFVVEQAAASAIRSKLDGSRKGPTYGIVGDSFETRSHDAFRNAQITYCADSVVAANDLTVIPLAKLIQDDMILRIATSPEDTEITVHVADRIAELVRLDADNRPGMPRAKYFKDLPGFCAAK